MSIGHNTSECLCPVCSAWLFDLQVKTKNYKRCPSCDYAREASRPMLSIIPDNIADGVDPLSDKPELIRPEDR